MIPRDYLQKKIIFPSAPLYGLKNEEILFCSNPDPVLIWTPGTKIYQKNFSLSTLPLVFVLEIFWLSSTVLNLAYILIFIFQVLQVLCVCNFSFSKKKFLVSSSWLFLNIERLSRFGLFPERPNQIWRVGFWSETLAPGEYFELSSTSNISVKTKNRFATIIN